MFLTLIILPLSLALFIIVPGAIGARLNAMQYKFLDSLPKGDVIIGFHELKKTFVETLGLRYTLTIDQEDQMLNQTVQWFVNNNWLIEESEGALYKLNWYKFSQMRAWNSWFLLTFKIAMMMYMWFALGNISWFSGTEIPDGWLFLTFLITSYSLSWNIMSLGERSLCWSYLNPKGGTT